MEYDFGVGGLPVEENGWIMNIGIQAVAYLRAIPPLL